MKPIISAVSVTLGVIAGILATTSWWIAPSPKKYESTKSYFFEQLKKQSDLEVIRDIEDVERVRDGVVELKNSRQLELADLERLLAGYSVVLPQFPIDAKGENPQKKVAEAILFVDGLITDA